MENLSVSEHLQQRLRAARSQGSGVMGRAPVKRGWYKMALRMYRESIGHKLEEPGILNITKFVGLPG